MGLVEALQTRIDAVNDLHGDIVLPLLVALAADGNILVLPAALAIGGIYRVIVLIRSVDPESAVR
ncbi:MAG: hypothetical protein QF415_16305 [Candidatus Undinarchaeales archaeon]|jgi:hypothetical protein|nr:hypothetical protein [Candidatus Undinarchaeales archaeon]